jgi:DNA-3-methyladenine glycosylase II
MEFAWQHVLNADPVMRGLASRITLTEIVPSADVFKDIVRSIIAQQLSTKAAATIFSRFMDLAKDEHSLPHFILQCEPQVLRNAGLSGQKCTYIREAASYFILHSLADVNWGSREDEMIIETLTKIKGVGIWTVQMLLIFSLNRNDVFPPDDLAIQQQMAIFYKLDPAGKSFKKEMYAIAESWKPYRSVASRLLWASRGIEITLDTEM